MLAGEVLFPSKLHAARFSFLDAIHLPLGANLGLKLRNRSQHIEEQAAGRITRIEVLVHDLEVDLLAGECIGDLTQVQGGASQAV